MTTESTSLLLVDDDDAFRTVLGNELGQRGFKVTSVASGEEAIGRAPDVDPDVVVLDLKLPTMDGLEVLQSLRAQCRRAEVIMLTGHGTIDTAIRAIRLGAYDYVSKPCPVDELQICIERAVERKVLRERNILLERGLQPTHSSDTLVGASPAFRETIELAERVAPTDSTVLIMGETGVGKDVLARLIHSRSNRADQPFVVVECAALSEGLQQSELFGHERGAFTSAERAKPGLFEVADGGTIFLDEIGEVSPATQAKLLRVLDTSSFRRVGGTRQIRADVRVLAATNRDVPELVRQELFRKDLFYRMSTITLVVPPLRERPKDAAALVHHYVGLFNERFGVSRQTSDAAMALLEAYHWPGNVRELVHAVERAIIVCDQGQILPEHLPPELRAASTPAAAAPDTGPLRTLRELEREHIEQVLRATDGHRQEAARILGIGERSLYRKLEEHKLR